MELDKYQQLARETAQYPTIGHAIIYPSLGLAGETGEFCDKVKKIFRDNDGEICLSRGRELANELGDCLWYVANCAHELGYSLEDIGMMNIAKLASRKERGTIGGNGDNR
jgi:NTP pyrophosphatase (non-canonical NTP hydrolase)